MDNVEVANKKNDSTSFVVIILSFILFFFLFFIGGIQALLGGTSSSSIDTVLLGEIKLITSLILIVPTILCTINVKAKKKTLSIIAMVLYFIACIFPMIKYFIELNNYEYITSIIVYIYPSIIILILLVIYLISFIKNLNNYK